MASLSTLSTTDASETTSSDKTIIPTDIDNEPIKFSGNPANSLGIAAELSQFFSRTGRFLPLIKDGAVLLGNSKLAIDSVQAVQFISGVTQDPVDYGFTRPCPDTVSRIKAYDEARTAGGKSSFTPIGSLPDDFKDQYVVSKYKISHEDRQLMLCIANVFEDSDQKDQMIHDCAGSGRTLITMLIELDKESTPADRALVTTRSSRLWCSAAW